MAWFAGSKLNDFDQRSLEIHTKSSPDPTPSLRAQLKRRCVCLSPTASPAPQGYHGSLASAVSCLRTSLLGSARKCFYSSTPKPHKTPKPKTPRTLSKRAGELLRGFCAKLLFVACLCVCLCGLSGIRVLVWSFFFFFSLIL